MGRRATGATQPTIQIEIKKNMLKKKPAARQRAGPTTGKPKKLTTANLNDHTRAHEASLEKKFSTPERVLKFLDTMSAKDKEQVWKQRFSCV